MRIWQARRASRRDERSRWWLVLAACALLLTPWTAPADGIAAARGSGAPLRHQEALQVPINQSYIVDLGFPVARVSVANPTIADILVVNPRQIYIVGKELGTTNMILWDDSDQIQKRLGLEITHDLSALKEKLYRLLPGEKIRVESAQGAIVLSGEVSSAQKMDAALRLAEAYARKPEFDRTQNTADGPGDPLEDQQDVLNLLQIGGAQQVLLEVKVAEIARTFIKRLDIDFTGIYDGGSVKLGSVPGGSSFPDADLAGSGRTSLFRPNAGLVGPVIEEIVPGTSTVTNRGLFGSYLSGNFFFNMVIDAARDQGLAKILAEPNLTALSGQEASFLAGGEFPIPSTDNDGEVDIEFKDFGIGLAFVPVVLDSGLISLTVDVSVSQLSNENSILVGSGSNTPFAIPALSTRRASSSVEVPSGQTIAIAGLINERLTEQVDKFPGLGSLPVLGALFRSQEYQKNQTELVIFVTPRLARPVQPDQVKLPTDDFVEPNDVEFYLMGRLEGRKPGERRSPTKLGPDQDGTEGPFGHDL